MKGISEDYGTQAFPGGVKAPADGPQPTNKKVPL